MLRSCVAELFVLRLCATELWLVHALLPRQLIFVVVSVQVRCHGLRDFQETKSFREVDTRHLELTHLQVQDSQVVEVVLGMQLLTLLVEEICRFVCLLLLVARAMRSLHISKFLL